MWSVISILVPAEYGVASITRFPPLVIPEPLIVAKSSVLVYADNTSVTPLKALSIYAFVVSSLHSVIPLHVAPVAPPVELFIFEKVITILES